MTTSQTHSGIPFPIWHEAQRIAAAQSAREAILWLQAQSYRPTKGDHRFLVNAAHIAVTHRIFGQS